MQSSKEQQEEIRKPSSAINAKKKRKTIEWERLEISSGKLEIPREHFAKMGSIKDRNGMDLTEAEDIKKKILKRREAKSKGEKERHKHLNAEFQRTAITVKKAILSDQYKEIEENNRMGKTRYLFKKIRDTKGTFHAKMDTIKDRNTMDLTEAEVARTQRRTIPKRS